MCHVPTNPSQSRSRSPGILAFLALAMAPQAVLGQTQRLATGIDPAQDGYLAIRTDGHGSWSGFASPDPAEPCDLYNPVGPAEPGNATFTTFFYLFVGDSRREILHAEAQLGPPHLDPSLSSELLSTPVASDTNGDGVPDTLDSSFVVAAPGGETRLVFLLRQRVRAQPGGVSYVQLDATVRNDGPAKTRFALLRTWDADLPWSSAGGSEYYTNDEVGTTANGPEPGRFVFLREPDDVSLAVTLSGPQGSFYFGGKHGVEPAEGPPRYDFGTDIDWWLAHGTPHTWRNHIAGVGYDTDGASGPMPPGSTDPADAFAGLESAVSLKPGTSATLRFVHTYGQCVPAAIP